jgi:hypothetical protein
LPRLGADFWKQVDKVDNPGGCWIWTGKKKEGYGVYTINGKEEFAHRLSFQAATGKDPQGKVVMHSCNHPYCVNPAHLSLGSYTQNNATRDKEGRTSQVYINDRYKKS